MPTSRIRTQQQLDDLMVAIKKEDTHFVGYEPPYAMVAIGLEMYEVPVGHLIPALISVARDRHRE